ncbi:MAG: endolytic transglycosylase MltG [Rubrobacter sp.]|nr:endolytic transglycosylase MltG [Rubrobacter sp.]
MSEDAEARRRRLRRRKARLTFPLQFSTSSPKEQRRKPEERRLKERMTLAKPLVLMMLLFVFLYLLASVASGGGGDTPVTVVVEEGDTLSAVADKLEETGVISSSTLFKLKARIEGGDTNIKPGEYQIKPGEDADKILELLSAGSTFTLSIPEGLTLKQTAQKVEETSGVPATEFEDAAKRTDYGYPFLDDPAIQTTEGFLFPKKYELEVGADASHITDRLLKQYSIETQDLDFAGAQRQFGLTEYEFVTVASLIEKEAANSEERPLVASVIYNRLRTGMPLQVDATIQYALGERKEKITLDDLKVESPYNTYTNPGLPPGPIASPSRDSIEAALNPAKTNYLYYVLKADGKEHFFTEDYDEFLEAKKDEH